MAQMQGWDDGPDTRGTMDILWMCLATMGLCVWTAVHPNIPVTYRFWPNFFERLGLMGVAVVFPEVILTTAWDEDRCARRLQGDVNKFLGYSSRRKDSKDASPRSGGLNAWRRRLSRPNSNGSYSDVSPLSADGWRTRTTSLSSLRQQQSKPQPWSFKQASYAVMGGFAMEIEYTHPNGEHRILRRIITSQGISILAQTGYLPVVDQAEIEERSKADVFAKIVVISQILWFALQVVGRLGQHLPVTPLETHTAIHVGCAILAYAIWIKKPYNLTRSIVVTGPDMQSIAALFYFNDISHEVFEQRLEQYEKDRIGYWKQRIVQASHGASATNPPPRPPVLMSLSELLAEYRTQPSLSTEAEEGYILHSLASHATAGLAALERAGCLSFQPVSRNLTLLRQSSENFTIRKVWGGWSTDVGHDLSTGKGLHVLFNVLYGALHLAAWSAFFPTDIERWLWRGSALFLVTVPIWGAVWILWWMGVRSQHRMLYLIKNGDLDIVAAPFFFMILVAYTMARCYFLIEALIGLRWLPVTAYRKVEWTEFLPSVT